MSAVTSFLTSISVDVPRQASDMNSENVSPHRTKKTKRIRFLCNGDRFCKGVVIPVNSVRYRSFDSLLTDLTRAFSDNVNLPCGVRIIFSMDGQRICELSELEDGKLYVCSSSGDCFKRVDYLSFNSLPRIKQSRSFSKLPNNNNNNNNNQNINSGSSCYAYKNLNNCIIRPRIIILVRNGNRPRKITRLLLNKRNAPSFEHALSTITEAVKLDTGAVRKVYTSKGVQLTQLEEFFGEDDVFIAYGSERLCNDDFDLDIEELKAIQVQKKSLRRPGNEETNYLLELGKAPKMPNKTEVVRVMKPNAKLNIPSKLHSRFLISQTIGDGSFAVVRRCTDRTTNTEYALKIIDKSKCSGKDRILSEVQILKTLQHPNIVQYILDDESPTEYFIVMEFIAGGDLFDAIAKYLRFSEENSKLIMDHIASALAYLHDHDIVHRDIKPENLMVEMDGENVTFLKVGDFGLAQKVDGPVYTLCGTPTYVAPEILKEVGYGMKIDVWAAGVILYIILCGFPPFFSLNNDQEELFDDILTGIYRFPSPYWDNISIQAKDLITHMLMMNPELRFSAEDVLDHPWLCGMAQYLQNINPNALYIEEKIPRREKVPVYKSVKKDRI